MPSAADLVDPRGTAESPPKVVRTPGQGQGLGYWNWDGIRYVWVAQPPAKKKAPYTWR
jgi:hypothetical protein